MQSLRHYFAETEQWADRPRAGDELDIELAPDELVEGRVVESDGEYIVLEISESAAAVMKQRGLLSERIGRYGAVGSSRAMGYTVAEGGYVDPNLHPQTRDYGRGEPDEDLPFEPDSDASDKDEFGNPIKHRARHLARRGMRQAMAQKPDEPVEEDYMPRMLELAGISQPVEETAPIQPNLNAARTDPLAAKAADLAPVGTEKDPGTATTIDEAVMKDIAIDLGEIADAEDYDRLYDLLTDRSPAGEMVRDMYADVAQQFRLHLDDDQDIILDRLMDRIVDDFGGQLDEAEYQGRKVELNKPKRGGSKKFYVYVKDPTTKNIRKVSFGDPNMKIKKSNPARRRSFRARHRCDNPGPKTSARYWACRSW
jgi:hypothetical protein